MKGWKTIAVAVIICVIGAAQAATDNAIIPGEATGYVLMVVSVLQIVLRSITNTPIGKK